MGEPLRIGEIAALCDDEALMAAEADGLLAVGADGEVRLAHPLYGEVIRAELPVLRARDMRRRVADTLRRREPLTPGDALRIARLLLDAGGQLPPELRVTAARAANLAGDPELGAQLARTALDDGAGLPAALLLARAHTVRKRWEAAEEALAAAAELVGPDDAGIDYLEQRTHVLLWGLDRPGDAWALLEQARSWSGAPEWQLRLEPLRAASAGIMDGAEGAIRPLEQVLADPGLDAETRLMAERRLALAFFFTGRTGAAIAHAREVLPTVPLRGYSDALALGLWRLLGFETGEGWAELETEMAGILRAAVRANDHEAAGHAAFSLGYTRFLAGLYRDADRWFAEAELHFERDDTFGTLIHVRALRVGVGVFGGDHEAAEAALERMRTALAGREPRSSQAPYVARAEGWAARLRSDAAGGGGVPPRRGGAHGADARLRGAAALRGAARGRAGGRDRRGARAAGGALRRAARRRRTARTPRRWRARDGDALLAVAGDLEAIGARRYALEAAAAAADCLLAAGRQDSRAARGREGARAPRAGPGRRAAGDRRPRRDRDRPDPPRGAGRGPGRPRPRQRGDRRPARAVGADGGDARLPRDAEARGVRPPRALTRSRGGEAQSSCDGAPAMRSPTRRCALTSGRSSAKRRRARSSFSPL